MSVSQEGEIQNYDVVIAGAGYAGLTLALQLSQLNLGLNIIILERRISIAPIASHKVGESTSELGAYYLRDKINLKNYLNEKQLRKYGFRFFFGNSKYDDLANGIEVGSNLESPYPTHQLDRGILENDLTQMAIDCGVTLQMGTVVNEIELNRNGHSILFEKENSKIKIHAKWFVDASGRSSLVKRKLNLKSKTNHQINAAWFRVNYPVDIQDWSNDVSWKLKVDSNKRKLATNHLMGKGYWVWIIALVSDATSFGIVADPRFHDFENFNTLEKAMNWLQKHEPLAASKIEPLTEKVLDFKVMKDFAYDTKQYYSLDKWALTGEAGSFIDAFYSPGADFIALGNTWITELIKLDFSGQDISRHAVIYDHAHKELFKGWCNLYSNTYRIFDNSQVMLMKIVWDWASYWAIPCVMFVNDGYTDINVLRKYASNENGIGKRFAKLNEQMQELFIDCSDIPFEKAKQGYFNVFNLSFLKNFQLEFHKQLPKEKLIDKIEQNLNILEKVAAEIFRIMSYHLNQTPRDLKVNPYEAKINDSNEKWLETHKLNNSMTIDQQIKSDIELFWFSYKISESVKR